MVYTKLGKCVIGAFRPVPNFGSESILNDLLDPETYLEFESGCFKIIFLIALNSPRNYISNPFKLPLNKIKITKLLAKKQFF